MAYAKTDPKAKIESGPKITFGADPEFFVVNQHNKLIPSWEIGIKGTKGNPERVRTFAEGNGVLMDGVAVEINLPPSRGIIPLRSTISSILGVLRELPGISEKKGKLSKEDFIEVPRKYRAHPGFREIGCVPDLDVYSESKIRPPMSPEEMGALRFAGGHLHVGCDPWPTWLPKEAFIKFLDVIYGAHIGFTTVSPRTKFYGKPGLWRETPYGIEYRSPNSLWCWDNAYSDDELGRIQDGIESILNPRFPSVEDSLAKLYCSGVIDEYSSQVGKGAGYGKYLDQSFRMLDRALLGKKLIFTPTPTELEGYEREMPDNTKIPVENRNAREPQLAGNYVFAQAQPRERRMVRWNVNDRPGEIQPFVGGVISADVRRWLEDREIEVPNTIRYDGRGRIGINGNHFWTIPGLMTFATDIMYDAAAPRPVPRILAILRPFPTPGVIPDHFEFFLDEIEDNQEIEEEFTDEPPEPDGLGEMLEEQLRQARELLDARRVEAPQVIPQPAPGPVDWEQGNVAGGRWEGHPGAYNVLFPARQENE